MRTSLPLFILPVILCVSLISEGQMPVEANVPSESITYTSLPEMRTVYGIFEGRPPCQQIAKQLQFAVSADCDKVKWRLIFHWDPKTKQPLSYSILGSFKETMRQGKWTISKGIPSNPEATVYTLTGQNQDEVFHLLKGDDNVLFILDENKNLRTGNERFSYTLNRVKLLQKSR